ncbi:MAG: class I SAM-dependent methyltransferase [Sphingomonas sp.]|uniref:class I SAM-dependent methyltransferase n=1 Tax=Sphingomonas sp. TaxID=28214 RepID=UPI001ACC74D3|nr:class I SAM-dependent methyltransferase [Sphingomonas sp.]MBN8814737.1 class I SAM-dependent methyltransferase [Sphingomonas sp.]
MFSTDEWTGRTGDVWADEWRRTDRSFAGLSDRLNGAILDVAPPHGHAVDLGCGAGQTSMALAVARPDLGVTGLDISPGLIAVARRRAEGIENLGFDVADTSALDPAVSADLFVSRHGVMFFPDPVAAFMTIRKAARPGARLVFSCFRERRANEWSLLSDSLVGAQAAPPGYVPGPFAFADRAFVGGMLARSGWVGAAAEAVDYHYVAGQGEDPIADAADFFTRIGPVARTIAEQPADRRGGLVERLKDLLAPHVARDTVAFPAAAWIWTATNGDAA